MHLHKDVRRILNDNTRSKGVKHFNLLTFIIKSMYHYYVFASTLQIKISGFLPLEFLWNHINIVKTNSEGRLKP